MRRLCSLAMLALVPCLAAALPAEAAARTKCQRLKGRDLAPAHTVKLVRRANADDGTDLVGCVLPRGRVHTIATSADQFTTMIGYAIRQIAGRIVLVDGTYSSQYAYTRSTRVADLRSGRVYSVAYQCFQIGNDDCAGDGSTSAPAAFVTKIGRAVAAVSPVTGAAGPPSTVAIATFDPRGARRDLDSGPAPDLPFASLRLTGVVASWTNAGVQRSADISEPG